MKAGKPVNECIYCGDTNVEDLRREHIIPYSLGADPVLYKASCKKCEDITKAFEGGVAGRMYKQFRLTRGRSRNKKRLPKETPFFLNRQGTWEQHNLPAEDHPSPFPIIRYMHMPGLMQIKEPKQSGLEFSVILFDEAIRKRFPRLARLRMIVSLRGNDHARMLAKIAHSATVYHLGLDGFNPLLKDFIRFSKGDPFAYIGGPPTMPFPLKRSQHRWEICLIRPKPGFEEKPIYVAVKIHLFGHLPTPLYIVVSGVANDLTQARLRADPFHG